jgi:hypothetical protein
MHNILDRQNLDCSYTLSSAHLSTFLSIPDVPFYWTFGHALEMGLLGFTATQDLHPQEISLIKQMERNI